MSRKSRERYPSVAIHITSRANHRNDIFRDEEDFKTAIINSKFEFPEMKITINSKLKVYKK